MIQIKCVNCGEPEAVADDAMNKKARCNRCGTMFYVHDAVIAATPRPPERATRLRSSMSPSDRPKLAARAVVAGAVLLVVVVMWPFENGTPSPTPSYTNEPQMRSSRYADPRDRRWDNPSGSEVVRGMAREAGVSEEEMRKALNDEIDRRGLQDWADR